MKNFILKIILWFLYRGIKVLNGRDSLVTREIKNLPENFTIKISSDIKHGKYVCFKINSGKVVKTKYADKIDLQIIFKDKNLAYRVFTGKLSIMEAYAEHCFIMQGNIYIAMGVTRILERVEGYLFPNKIRKRCLSKPFKREISMFKTYLLCLF